MGEVGWVGWVKCDGWVGKSVLGEVGWVKRVGINRLNGLDGLGEGDWCVGHSGLSGLS